MLDLKHLRTHLEEVAQILSLRGFHLEVELIQSLEAQRKQIQHEVQSLQNLRNQRSKAIGQVKAKGEDISALKKEVETVTENLAQLESNLTELQSRLEAIYLRIPNILHETVPIGKTEEDNIEIRRWGEPTRFDFQPKDHIALGEQHRGLDFLAAAKLSGARFVVMHRTFAQLHRALVQFMLDLHTRVHGYQEVYVPYLVQPEILVGTGQLPKFDAEQFKIEGDRCLYLIPTAEVPVTNLAREHIFAADELPIRYVCHTPCFRSEAGSYGKDTRGMIRQHQFEKVELVQLVLPEHADEAHESLTQHAEAVLQQLELPYRVVVLCSGDLGFAAAKTYDLEVWIPSQARYREISSCSYYEAYQARRMQARWRDPNTGKIEFLHTLNGSALAIGRTLVAIIENYQDEQGRIHIPQVLQAYMNGLKVIE